MTNAVTAVLSPLALALQGPDLPGRPAGTPAAAPAADAAQGAAATAPPSGAGGTQMLIMVAVMLGAMILFQVVGGRREKKKREQMLAGIKRHDKVVTIGGIVGSVVELKDDSVILKVDETSNTRITFAKSAISQVMPQDAGA